MNFGPSRLLRLRWWRQWRIWNWRRWRSIATGFALPTLPFFLWRQVDDLDDFIICRGFGDLVLWQYLGFFFFVFADSSFIFDVTRFFIRSVFSFCFFFFIVVLGFNFRLLFFRGVAEFDYILFLIFCCCGSLFFGRKLCSTLGSVLH